MLGEPTGIEGLDTVTYGLSPLGLTLILGAPGEGKTTLAMQIASHAMRNDRDVIYLSMFSESHEKLLAHLQPFSFFDLGSIRNSMEMLSLKSFLDVDPDPDAVSRMIFTAARGKRQPLLVLDGYRGVQAAIGQDVTQRVLSAVASQLPYLGASCLITAEFSTFDVRDYPELTIADGIIALSRLRYGGGRYRMLEVTKLRGHAFREGPHGMRITSDGIVVYPRLATVIPDNEPDYTDSRQRFDLPELDAMLGGGLPVHSATVIAGHGGTGKTTLALQYLVAGARQGQPGLLVTFREPVADLVRKATDLGIDLVSHLEAGTMRILRLPPIELPPDEVAWRIVDEVQRHKIERLAIDGVEDLERTARVLGDESDYLAAFLEYLRRSGTTTVLLHDTNQPRMAGTLVFPVTPNRILLRRVEFRERWYRVISILSMQASAHETSIREFRMSAGGIRILHLSESAPDVLAGISGEQLYSDV